MIEAFALRRPAYLSSTLAPSRPLLLGLVLLMLTAVVPAAAQRGEEECTPSDTALCLIDGRFRVEVEWTDVESNPLRLGETPLAGEGMAAPLPSTPESRTGSFWFFREDNIELVVSVLDGRQINGFFWVFYGSLTNVEYTIRVVDTQTGEMARYRQEQGMPSRGSDTRAFQDAGTGGSGNLVSPAAATLRRAVRTVRRSAGELPSCDDAGVTCLQGGRIALQATARTTLPNDPVRVGEPVLATDSSAILSFFPDQSPGLAVKVLDGRAVNGEFWLFASTPQPPPNLDVRVTDLETGEVRVLGYEGAEGLALADATPFVPEPPEGPWMETGELPGFRFKVRVTGGGGVIPTRQEADCVPETLCVSGAIPGRSELFVRIVGPKPNGFLWPNLVKFSTSQLEVWIEQLATEQLNYYRLDAAAPGSSELTGFFDRTGFQP